MMKKIISLSKILFLDYYQNLNIVKNKKVNKKSLFFWMALILIFAIGWLSYQSIKFLNRLGEPQIFLNIYLWILGLILTFQTIIVCTNVFYFSKDLEYILPLPIKPVELLIAKFNTILGILYASELIFAVTPLLMYGMIASANLLYFLWMICIILIFPLFPATVVGILMLFIMKLAKFIKNKDVFQLVIVIVLMLIISSLETALIKNIFAVNYESETEVVDAVVSFNKKLELNNKYLLFINPSVNMLSENNNLICFFNLIKLLILNLISFILFVFIGKITYLKNILKNLSYVSLKKTKSKKIKNKYKLIKKDKAYIIKEIKLIFKNPVYFMQCVLPILAILILLVFVCGSIAPSIKEMLKTEELANEVENLKFDLEVVAIILGLIQLLFTVPSISLTAISREGKNAIFLKYIPISFYKQFIYKNIPQFIINTIIIITTIFTINIFIYNMNVFCILIIFIIAMFMNLINCYLMLLVDLHEPKLDWSVETAAVKQNKNKMFQYILTIAIILIIYYLTKVLEKINLYLSIVLMAIIFGIVFLTIDRVIKKNENKLFNKIY